MPRIKSLRLPLDGEVYEIAREEAMRCGFRCTGSKVRHDIEEYYRRLAKRRTATKGGAK